MRVTLFIWLLLPLTQSYGFYSYFNNFLDASINATRSYYQNVYNQRQKLRLELDDDYDFIIVGSGSAGSVIANRLSEIPHWKILLLETGNRANFLNQIPIMAPVYQVTPYNWNFTMEKQEGFCMAMDEGKCAWPRGRALGGSTVINYMIYTRGKPNDYERWEKAGNPGWSYQDVLPYFLKSENCNLDDEVCNSEFHNQGGYLNIENAYSNGLTDAFLNAGTELGHDIVDYNTPINYGFSKIQATLKNGRRHSVATAFLDPVAHRKNLKIVTGATVTKILIDPDTKEAYGVKFQKGKAKYTARANKEVILSAGAFKSPQLLMLSGIGPKDHLNELDIKVLKNLPVGQTLVDHISYLGMLFKINETLEPGEQLLDPRISLDWLVNGRGFLTSLGGIEAIAYINTEDEKNFKYPDIELLLVGIGSLQFDRGLFSRPQLRVKQKFYDEYFKPIENVPCYSIIPMLLHPKSKGFLKLRSKNPFDSPKLNGNYLSDPKGQDLRTLIKALRYMQKISQTNALQKLGSILYEKPLPGCEDHIFNSDQYWECALRSLGVTLHHQIGTCKMGPKTDPTAVVDHKLRVHGVGKLRVADTSIIPVTISSHTNAPSIMIGERASDFLKEEWNEIKS